MSNQFDKKEDAAKPPPISQHPYARRPPAVVTQGPSLVPLQVIPGATSFRDGSSERPSIPNSTSVSISTTRPYGVPTYNRPPSMPQAPIPSIPIPPQPVMQVSEHHLPNQGPVLHHPSSAVPQQVLASGILGQLSLQQLPASSQAQMHAQQQQQHQSQFQRLKVEDALSYLDQVKLQFGNQPQVYNDFLDIMKEFKSQSIDTPGVIQRVSSLFAGHADLIVGFNTFLPPGYKIEVSGNDQVSVTGPNMLQQTINTQHGGAAQTIQIHTPQTKYVTPPNQGGQSSQPPHLAPQPSHASTPSSSMFTPSHTSQTALSVSSAANIHPPSSISSAAPGVAMANSNTPIGASVPPPPVLGQQPQVGSQPVEFNHAINYVNKIKHRFQGQTDIYKAFLEILHKYQKEQRTVKETNGGYTPTLSESEVYSQVAKLFKNDEDLLREFGQFLPDAGGGMGGSSGSLSALTGGSQSIKQENLASDHASISKKPPQHSSSSAPTQLSGSSKSSRPSGHQSIRRPGNLSGSIQGKKVRSCSLKDVSLAEASRHGALAEFGFFDKVRRALGSQDVYDNFLRCLLLFNNEVIGRAELVQLIQPFLMKFPELFGWFKRFLGYKEGQMGDSWSSLLSIGSQQQSAGQGKEKHEGMAMEIDYTTLKRLGSSYRALPMSYDQPKCTGRDVLCKEVLNDTWVSFPSWSEDSQSVTSKKTQFEEHVYRCEDERFELDVVLETNLATILVLEAVNKDLSRMTDEEKSKFKLDNCLGGTSEVIHRKAIHRIYGDKATDIIDGLKKNPAVAVPVVLKRLKMKDEEWREAQHQFNKVWREQNEKYYLKSLDHQGINFKQNDTRFLRSKSLLNEIESLFDERQEALENGANAATLTGPHMTLTYEDKSMMDDCASLIIHHVKRQSGVHKDDKQKMKVFMYQTLPDLFFSPRGNQPSDDDDEDTDSDSKSSSSRNGSKNGGKSAPKPKPKSKITGGYSLDDDLDGMYHLLMCSNPFYLFMRLHEILCSRLLKIYRRAEILAEEDAKEKKESNGKESVADMLRLKQVNDIEVIDYYPAFLEMVRNLLDGNVEVSQYEDQLRDMFTIHAYIAFTMDRLVTNIVRQLQHIVQDDQCAQLLQLYIEEEKNGATGGSVVSASRRAQQEGNYQRRAEQLMTEDNCYKMTVVQKKSQLHVEIQLLDTDDDQDEVGELIDSAKWSDYIEQYLSELQDEMPSGVKERILQKAPVFMQRNAVMYRKLKKRDRDDKDDDEMETDKKSSQEKRAISRLHCSGGMEVNFARNSYKVKFVPGKEHIVYRENALKRAREGQDKRNKLSHDKFQAKVAEWGRENVSRDMSRQCTNWLMGKVPGPGVTLEDLSNCTTICKIEKIGLVSRNRYRVDYHDDEKASSTV